MRNSQRTHHACIYYIISILLLMAGAAIYLTCRHDIIFISMINTEILNTIRIEIKSDNLFMYLLRYCLPDGLWYASLLTTQLVIDSKIYIYMFLVVSSTPFVLELMQYFHFMPGTFDWLDIITYLLTLIIFILCVKKHFYR